MTKIKVVSIVVKKEGTSASGSAYKIYEADTEAHGKLDTFDYLEPGQEHEGEIEQNANPAYNSKFKLPKTGGGKKGFQKDYTFEKKRVALECAVSLVASGHVPMTNMVECRDKFFQYLNG